MTAVSPKPISHYPWFIRLFFWKQKRTYGKVLEPGLLWGRSPWVFATVALLYGALNRRSSPIPPALRSLVTVRVSQINHCAFCVDINSATLLQRGVPMAKVEDEDTLVELTGQIAFQNLSSKFNAALDVPPQGFCTVLLTPGIFASREDSWGQ